MMNVYCAGQIVRAKYTDITTGKSEVGFFLIIHSDFQDPNNSHQDNYVGVKVTSNVRGGAISGYGVYIDHNKVTGLSCGSYALCNRFYLFHIDNILGQVADVRDHKYILSKVYSALHTFVCEVERQVLQAI